VPRRVGITTPLRQVWLLALPVGAYSCLALFKSSAPFSYVPDIPVAIDAALSVAMALILAFRVNRSYERWWEARTLWGSLVNVSRNLAVKIRELVDPNQDDRQTARDLVVAFSAGLKDHLRSGADLKSLPGFETNEAVPSHVPSYIVARLYRLMKGWQQEGKLSDGQLWILDREARELLEVCGACERIKKTLMSISWRFFTWQCITLYLLVLPWGLVDDLGAWVVPLSTVIAYFVMAGEGIAHYVEEPFGLHEDHLDLDSICAVINTSVSEVLLGDGADRN